MSNNINILDLRKKIFLSFIDYLKFINIDYCIVGNVTSYPDALDSDIDIVVSNSTYLKINELIKQFCESNKYLLCNRVQHEATAKRFDIALIDHNAMEIGFLALDICSDYRWDSYLLIKSNILLQNRKLINFNGSRFYVCYEPINFLYYLIKKIVKKDISQFQFLFLVNLWTNNKVEIYKSLQHFFSKKLLSDLIYIFDNKDFTLFNELFLRKLKNELYKNNSKLLAGKLRNIGRIYNRMFKPTGLVVAFLGCDGSGKSTLINSLKGEKFSDEIFQSYKYYHLYPYKSKNHKQHVSINPHNQILRSKFLSNLKILYWFSFFTFGYWRWIHKFKVKNNLIIFDRYYQDILVDPKRYRHNGNNWLTLLVERMIPKPELFFIIDAPEDLILSRKQEVSRMEVKRQRYAYLELHNTLNNTFVIDNSQTPETATFRIKSKILSYLESRYK